MAEIVQKRLLKMIDYICTMRYLLKIVLWKE